MIGLKKRDMRTILKAGAKARGLSLPEFRAEIQEKAEKSTIRRQIDVSLDELTDEELKIIQGTIDGIMKYKGTGSK